MGWYPTYPLPCPLHSQVLKVYVSISFSLNLLPHLLPPNLNFNPVLPPNFIANLNYYLDLIIVKEQGIFSNSFSKIGVFSRVFPLNFDKRDFYSDSHLSYILIAGHPHCYYYSNFKEVLTTTTATRFSILAARCKFEWLFL
jgi:hypothetical protein